MKRIKLFFLWRKTLKKFESELNQQFDIRLDKASRLYTVLNIPEDIIGESYLLKKADVERITQNYVKAYLEEVNGYLSSKGLTELFRVYEINRIEKYSYLIVIGYSLFKSHRFLNIIYYILTPILVLSMIILGIIIF
jgi:hypothetical protein